MDIQDLVASISLEDVVCIERAGHLKFESEAGLAGWQEAEPDASPNLEVNSVSWDQRIETWFRLNVEHPSATVRAAYAVIYTRESNDEIPAEVRKEFLERVAAMSVFPYLRQAIQQLAAELRLGNFVIPIVRQGDVEIHTNDAPPA